MNLILLSCAIILSGALFSLLAPRRLSGPIAAITLIAGSIIGLIPVLQALITGNTSTTVLPWQFPFATIKIAIDPLSAVFALPVLLVPAISSIYGCGYLAGNKNQKHAGLHWFFFNILALSMLVVVLAKDAILFLLSWETMSLSSFFLVLYNSERSEVRRAGWIYLVATHIGTACIIVLFLMLATPVGSFDFDKFNLASMSKPFMTAVFILTVAGFGTKAGLIPMHIWLPEAHPAAPSHVSAVMSGVMIKTGIYGIIRILFMIYDPPLWFGWTLILLGALSGILGILFALSQHDLKRLLAYSSVENIGIITMSLGLTLLGIAGNNNLVAFFGCAGALMHVVNHSLFKSLLFLCAGSVLHAKETAGLDRLGGLLKKMRITGFAFLAGSIAICGLPPLNGFAGEFLIYNAALSGITDVSLSSTAYNASCLIALVTLAVIGGLSLACFTNAFGSVFLGEERFPQSSQAHESCIAMQIPMLILAGLCILTGLAGSFAVRLVKPAVMPLLQTNKLASIPDISGAYTAICGITSGAIILTALLVIFTLLHKRNLSGRQIKQTVTWDCGYLKPDPRMQYTASSFASPITKPFAKLLGTRHDVKTSQELFPYGASFSTETKDIYGERFYKPVFRGVKSLLSRFLWLQHGRLNLYILYIVATLIALLAWKLGS